MFVTVPALRIASAARGRRDEHVALITHGEGYERAARDIDRTLERHGIEVEGDSKVAKPSGGRKKT